VPVKQPEPKPTPPKEKTAEQKPQPVVKPDAVAEAIAADQPADSVKLPDAAPAPDARPKPQPAQAETAKAPDRKNADKPVKEASSKPKSADNALDDKIAALLNKQKASGGGAKRSTEQASLGGEKSTGGSKLSQNEMDALRQKLGGCWSIPAGVDDAETLKVSVKFRLDRSGELEGRPEVIKGGAPSGPGRTAAESAVRAVQKCAPFNLPSDKYDTWAEVVVNFDPSDMF
jgi:colicin import membrane protein